jgi:MFS transporter, DHA1 family, multidrug resistance protein
MASGHPDLIVATLALAISTFTVGSMQTILPLYAASLGATVEQWGLIAAMWGVAMAVGEPFWGWVHDRAGYALPVAFRAIGAALAFVALAVVPWVWPLYLLNLWRGFTDAAPWPASRSLASRSVSAGRTALAMATLWTGARLGSAIGAFTSGQIASAAGYQPTLIVSAAVSLLAILLIAPRLRSPGRDRPARSVRDVTPSLTGLRMPRPRLAASWSRYRPLAVLGTITVLSSLGWGALTFLPFLVTSSLGGTVADVGLLFTIPSLVITALMIPMGSVGDRVSKKVMVVVGVAVYAVAMAGIGFAGSFVWVMALMILGGVGQAASRPSIEALVSASSSPEERGSVMGIYGTCEDLGGILGPVLGSLMWGAGGPAGTYLVFGCLIGVGSLVAAAALPARAASPVAPSIV